MNKTPIWVVGLVVGALVLAACSSSSGDQSADSGNPSTTTTTTSEDGHGISIKDFAFGPSTLAISVGETVTWANNDDGIAHTTTSDDDVWQSGALNPGDTFEFTFNEPGIFTYFCSIHPSMTATITVEG